jgi:hypothetical protein
MRATAAPLDSVLTAPILPTLLKLALPNSIAMFGSTLVAVAVATALSVRMTRWGK